MEKIESSVRSYTFKVIVEEDPFEDGTMAYHAYCPALRHHGASTWGYSQEEALRNIQEVVRLVIESMLEHGESIPAKPEEDVKRYLPAEDPQGDD
ncbi:MAG: type II toxin-antitoxin system HicB family antitoxin [Candidatus Bipolaricaulia bacterium]